MKKNLFMVAVFVAILLLYTPVLFSQVKEPSEMIRSELLHLEQYSPSIYYKFGVVETIAFKGKSVLYRLVSMTDDKGNVSNRVFVFGYKNSEYYTTGGVSAVRFITLPPQGMVEVRVLLKDIVKCPIDFAVLMFLPEK